MQRGGAYELAGTEMMKTMRSSSPRPPSHRRLRLATALLLASAQIACVRELTPTTPPPAPALTQLPETLDVPMSTVQLLVPVAFEDLNRIIDESIPSEVASLSNIRIANGVTGSFSLSRAGSTTLLANNGRLQIIMPLRLDISGTWSTTVFGQTIGHTERASTSFVVAVDSRIAANESWEATTQSEVDFQIAETDVGIGPLRFDVRELLSDELRPYLEVLRDAIDTEMSEALDLRGRMERIWPNVLAPIEVSDDPALFIQLEPEEVQWVRPTMVDGQFTFGLGVSARVRSYLGASPTVSDTPPLPRLREVEAMSNGFHVAVPLQVSYETLTAQARAELVGSERTLESGATVRIDGVDIRGSTDARVHIACEITARKGILKSAHGTLHMMGVPRYDAETRVVRFEEVSYDLDTRNVLLRAANWAMHDDFLSGVQDALVFEVGDVLDEALRDLNESAREIVVSDQLTLHVSVAQLGIGPIFVSDRSIVVVGVADGTVAADVRLFTPPSPERAAP